MIRLVGGPMDGHLIRPGAPALRPDWYEGWVAWMALFDATPDVPPGRYEPAEPDEDGTEQARWVEVR